MSGDAHVHLWGRASGCDSPGLLNRTRTTECGAKPSSIRQEARAVPGALLIARLRYDEANQILTIWQND